MNTLPMKISAAAIKHISAIGVTILTAFASPAFADGQAVAIKIRELATTASAGNIVYIRLTSPPTTPAVCSTHPSWHFTLDLDSAFGKSTYALLLEAFASGRNLTLYGTNTCFGNVEMLRYLTAHG